MRKPTITVDVTVRSGDSGSAFAQLSFDSRAFAWRPSGEQGRASWGRYLGARWLGLSFLWQRFDHA